MTPMYKKSMQSLKINSIGLKLSPPLLLGMLEGRKEEVERKAGFYKQEEEMTSEAWDVREATKAMNDMEID